jgi:hypothetical protein
MSTPPIGTWIWQAILTVAIPLVGLVLGAVGIRRRWKQLPVRVASSVVVVVVLAASGPMVDRLVQARLNAWMRGSGTFMCILPGYVVWLPAIAGLLSLGLFLLVSMRKAGRGAAA